jgi:hypothetical protein
MTKKRLAKAGWYGADGKVRRGLPEVNVEAFVERADQLRRELFQPDEDGDLPLTFTVTDRTLHVRTYPLQIRHVHYLRGKERRDALVENLRELTSHASTVAQLLRAAIVDVREEMEKLGTVTP